MKINELFLKPIYEKINNLLTNYSKKGVVLFENNDGVTNGTYTLSDSITNYNYIEVFASCGTSKKYRFPGGTTLEISVNNVSYSDVEYNYTVNAYLSKNSMQVRYNHSWYLNINKENTEKIYRVVGYK
jgi:hypothetical protein